MPERARQTDRQPLILSLLFTLIFLLLNLPEVIVIADLGSVAWYPATGLALALMLSVSPWYFLLTAICGAVAGTPVYQQPLLTFMGTVGNLVGAGLYAAADWVLRGPLRINFGMRHRRDVACYVATTSVAALGSALIGSLCLAADHAIAWSIYWRSAVGWFLGDEVGLLGVAPFLLIHVTPLLRKRFSSIPALQCAAMDFSQANFRYWSALEGGAQAVTLLVLLRLIFGPPFGPYTPLYLTFIPILWMAMRQGISRIARRNC